MNYKLHRGNKRDTRETSPNTTLAFPVPFVHRPSQFPWTDTQVRLLALSKPSHSSVNALQIVITHRVKKVKVAEVIRARLAWQTHLA